jgi:hypothetical protein
LHCVVCVCQSILDGLHTALVELVEPITGVGDLVWLDTEKRAVLDDGILELLLLLGRVGVVKSQQELALVLLVREVIVEQRCFGVTDVKVTSGIRLAEGSRTHRRREQLTKAQAGT